MEEVRQRKRVPHREVVPVTLAEVEELLAKDAGKGGPHLKEEVKEEKKEAEEPHHPPDHWPFGEPPSEEVHVIHVFVDRGQAVHRHLGHGQLGVCPGEESVGGGGGKAGGGGTSEGRTAPSRCCRARGRGPAPAAG